METDSSLQERGPALFAALEAAEPCQATLALTALAESLHRQGGDDLDLQRAWDLFQRLLDRRGYYVDTPDRLAASLKEIEAIGAGFDLYDLARSLARYDAVRTKCRKLAADRLLPELKPFAPTCGCSKRRKET